MKPLFCLSVWGLVCILGEPERSTSVALIDGYVSSGVTLTSRVVRDPLRWRSCWRSCSQLAKRVPPRREVSLDAWGVNPDPDRATLAKSVPPRSDASLEALSELAAEVRAEGGSDGRWPRGSGPGEKVCPAASSAPSRSCSDSSASRAAAGQG